MEGSSLHPNQQGPDKGQSVKLQFDLAGAAPHRADHDLHVLAQPGHQLQQFGLADAAKLAARPSANDPSYKSPSAGAVQQASENLGKGAPKIGEHFKAAHAGTVELNKAAIPAAPSVTAQNNRTMTREMW